MRHDNGVPGLGAEVAGYLRRDKAQEERLRHLLRQMREGQDLGNRRNMDGHVVSSVLVLDRTGTSALLVHHRAYGLWLTPGGHFEGPGNAHASALRELAEETGLVGTNPHGGAPLLLDIDTHEVPARPEKDEPAHVHHDLLYLEHVGRRQDPSIRPEEVLAAEWRPLARMSAAGGRQARLAALARDALRGIR